MSDRWQIGDRIADRYEIHSIKKGGMGTVFLCYDHLGKTPVAIKTFQHRLFKEDKTLINRFKWEAEVWVRIGKHKNIVTAFYFDLIEGRPHIFLEYIVGDERYGPDLEGWIDNGGLNIHNGKPNFKKCIDLAIQFCNGMICAERRFNEIGEVFVHRDIKPSNVMIRRDGVLKVTDFGLVKAFSQLKEDITVESFNDSSEHKLDAFSKSGNICGTPPYMSPEQCLQGPQKLNEWGILSRKEASKIEIPEIDIRSDLYSFGCVLYEMFTGRFVFSAEKEIDFLYHHIHTMPQPIKYIPKTLSELIMKCLEKKATNRYQNFSLLKDELVKIYYEITGESITLEGKEVDPTNREVMLRGASLDNLGYHKEALSLLNKVAKKESDKYYVYHSLAVTSMRLCKYDEAIKNYTSVLNHNPPKELIVHIYYDRGYAFMQLKQFEEALKDFDRAIELGMRIPQIYNERACVQAELKSYEHAIGDFEQALKLNPSALLVNK